MNPVNDGRHDFRSFTLYDDEARLLRQTDPRQPALAVTPGAILMKRASG
jgi:hypothetical protein